MDTYFSVSRERYYTGIKGDSRLHVKLTGNWETFVGEQDTFVHILEYENYGGYDKTTQLVKTSEVRTVSDPAIIMQLIATSTGKLIVQCCHI